MILDATIEVELAGTYHKTKDDVFSYTFGNWLPGVQEYIENFAVLLVRVVHKDGKTQVEKLDITDYLNNEEHEDLYNDYLEDCREAYEET